ncbi:MAG: hypothetical protein P8130_06455 [Deltaproteobacteria bacterium]
MSKVKEIKELCTGVLKYVEHIILPIDVEISQKGRFGWELTNTLWNSKYSRK